VPNAEVVVNDGGCRRAQQRYDIEIPLELAHEGQVYTTVTRNMSLGGLFMNLDSDIPFGAVVRVKFSLPELDTPVEVDAHVRWVQPGVGIGVQYVGLRAREVWALQQLFAKPA
jgi:Tfp pilus assembly protein PilZ